MILADDNFASISATDVLARTVAVNAISLGQASSC